MSKTLKTGSTYILNHSKSLSDGDFSKIALDVNFMSSNRALNALLRGGVVNLEELLMRVLTGCLGTVQGIGVKIQQEILVIKGRIYF